MDMAILYKQMASIKYLACNYATFRIKLSDKMSIEMAAHEIRSDDNSS